MVGKPARVAAETCSRLIERKKQWWCGGQCDSTPKNGTDHLTLVAGGCCRYLAAVVLERPSSAPLPIQRPKHIPYVTYRYGPMQSNAYVVQPNSAHVPIVKV